MNGQGLGDIPLTRRMGWGSLALEPAEEGKGVKHPLTPEALGFSRGAAHI